MEEPTNVALLETRFFDNETGYGFLINQPGLPPLIYLNRTLLGEESSGYLYRKVYDTLFNLYTTLDVWELLFPFTRFYEDVEAKLPKEDEIIILGRFKRAETTCKVCESKLLGYRLIG